MQAVLLVIHVLVAVALIGLVLVQHGKGADMGAAFGSGASQTLFGSRGSANVLTRITAVLATIFFVTSLTLAYFGTRQGVPVSVTHEAPANTQPSAPTSTPAVPQGDTKSGVNNSETKHSDAPAVPQTPAVPK